jgi:hypothetical protein
MIKKMVKIKKKNYKTDLKNPKMIYTPKSDLKSKILSLKSSAIICHNIFQIKKRF